MIRNTSKRIKAMNEPHGKQTNRTKNEKEKLL